MAKGILIRIVATPIDQMLHNCKLKHDSDLSQQCQKFERLLQNAVEAGHIFENKIKMSSPIHLAEKVGFANSIHAHKIAIPIDEEFPALDAIMIEFIENCVETTRIASASLSYNNSNNGGGNDNNNGPNAIRDKRNGVTASQLAIQRTTVGSCIVTSNRSAMARRKTSILSLRPPAIVRSIQEQANRGQVDRHRGTKRQICSLTETLTAEKQLSLAILRPSRLAAAKLTPLA
jgi:hypothetical protein